MTVKEILDRTVEYFKKHKLESPRREAELILYSSFGFKDRMDLYLNFEKPVSEPEIVKSRSWVQRRAQGEPLAYLLGEKGFYKEVYKVGPGVLIPRPETEGLVEEALSWIAQQNKKDLLLADLGAGSGCLGLSVLKNIPSEKNAQLDLFEKSKEAIFFLEQNKTDTNSEIMNFDLDELQKLPQNYDLILSNPPYISIQDQRVDESVKKYEPHLALFGGEAGIEKIEGWFKKFHHQLNTPGLVLVEFGMGQEKVVEFFFNSLKVFKRITINKDCFGVERWISAEK